ncbi:cyclase-associated protein 1-like [Raphanus sativus]|uniref:Cyclase-associated protein 1-like n=1 Tax=Raphanus sativus TaxID=3726 RepID=A0A9W3DQX4_RAPSA|nr:cyclase-associated protein 1-like [Raphanus sativus]
MPVKLSKDSLETAITTAKSSEINVMVPGSSPGGDWVEHAPPQQYNHVFTEGKFETTPRSRIQVPKLRRISGQSGVCLNIKSTFNLADSGYNIRESVC